MAIRSEASPNPGRTKSLPSRIAKQGEDESLRPQRGNRHALATRVESMRVCPGSLSPLSMPESCPAAGVLFGWAVFGDRSM